MTTKPIEIKGEYSYNVSEKKWSYKLNDIKIGDYDITTITDTDVPEVTRLNVSKGITSEQIPQENGQNHKTRIEKVLLNKYTVYGGNNTIQETQNISNSTLDVNNSNNIQSEQPEQPLPQSTGGKKKSSHKSKSTQKRKQKKNNKTRFAQRKR